MKRYKQKVDAQHQEQDVDPKLYVITTGWFGGLFAAGLTYLAFFLNFIPYGPGVIWRHFPFFKSIDWLGGPVGHVMGIGVISLSSLITAFLYYYLFRRFNSPWAGVLYGLAVWVFVFLGVNEWIPGTKAVAEMELNTTITFICIFIVYGLFIGYSISYEYNDKIG